MKTNCIITIALAGALALAFASTGIAEPSQTELAKQARITRTEAQKNALAKVPGGKIQSEELENEHNALVWSFDIAQPRSKNITEVLVNAKTGKIVSVTHENPTEQANEAAADKKANGGR